MFWYQNAFGSHLLFFREIVKSDMPYLIFFIFIRKMNMLESWLWSVYTEGGEMYM